MSETLQPEHLLLPARGDEPDQSGVGREAQTGPDESDQQAGTDAARLRGRHGQNIGSVRLSGDDDEIHRRCGIRDGGGNTARKLRSEMRLSIIQERAPSKPPPPSRAEDTASGRPATRTVAYDSTNELRLANYSSGVYGTGGGFRDENREELVQLVVGIDGMAKGAAGGDGVAVATPGARSRDIAGLNKVSCDLLRCALRHPHPRGDVSHPDLRITGDGEQNVGVVGEERPPRPAGGHGGCP